MWIGFMHEALAKTAEQRPKRPRGIVEFRINPETGLIADDRTPNAIFEKFDIDHVPEREAGLFIAPDDTLDPGTGPRPPSNPFGFE